MSRFIDLDSPTIYKIGRDKFGNVLYSIPPDTEYVCCEDCKKQNIGKWESYVFDGPPGMRPTTFVCSNCNCISTIKTNYCCHCGKQMKE